MNVIAEASNYYAANPGAQQADQAVMQSLLARSATDAEFRAQLLSDPRAAVAEFTGRALPESFDAVFIENTADVTFVLPPAIDPQAELSESELEAVSGGTIIEAAIIGFTIGAITYLVAHAAAEG